MRRDTGSNATGSGGMSVAASIQPQIEKGQKMHYKKSFPGKFLQTTDLDAPMVVTIARVTLETVGVGADAESKPIAHFEEPDTKSLVLNVTKCEAIATIADDEDMDGWPGVRIRLSRGTTRYQGKTVACIVVDAPPRKPPHAMDDADGPEVGF